MKNEISSSTDNLNVQPLSLQNAKILSKLKQKKFRDEAGKVVIEGCRLIDQVLANGIMPEALITCDKLFNGQLPFSSHFNGQIWQTTSSHMEQICDTKQPQAWAAIMPCKSTPIKDKAFVLYLDNIQDPGNMGTIFRTAAAAGISGIVRSSTCCELFNPKVIRASLGAVFFVATEIHETDYINSFPGTRIAMCMDGSDDIFTYEALAKNILLILGSEAEGIQPGILKAVDVRMRIPIKESMESLNVSVSAGISIFLLKNKLKS